MLIITFLGLLFLWCANYFAWRSYAAPGCVFTLAWLVAIAGLFIYKENYYDVSAKTLSIYIYGALGFYLGGLAVKALWPPLVARRDSIKCTSRGPRIILDALLAMELIALPLMLIQANAIVSFSDPLYFLKRRASSVEAMNTMTGVYSMLDNVVILSQFVALALHYENDGTLPRRIRSWVAIAAAVVLGSISGTKGNVVTLLIALSFISVVRKDRDPNYKVLIIALGMAVVCFGVGMYFVDFALAELRPSWEAVTVVSFGIMNYWLCGVVAFDQIALSPGVLETAHRVDRFFLESARSLGYHVYIPPLHADFVLIGPGLETNIYTFYYALFNDYQWWGVVIWPFLLGAITTSLFSRIRPNTPGRVILYGWMSAGLLLSTLSDKFLIALNPYIKLCLFLACVYSIAPKIWKGAAGQ